MDGGRRLLQSLKETLLASAPAGLALSGAGSAPAAASASRPVMPRPAARVRRPRRTLRIRLLEMFGSGSTSLALCAAFLGGAFVFAAVKGGQYDAFISENGAIEDILARNVGFGLDSVTLVGVRELTETEVLQAAGITSNNSLMFLNAANIRDRLLKAPLVQDASVRKLFPNKLLIEITERAPFALWQKDGAIMAISADGTAIEELHDARFAGLPFVVGGGANLRIAEFQKIVEAGGDLRTRVRAGVLVGERRWNIKMMNGLDVLLPAKQPELAFSEFARLSRDARIADKDLISVDLRVPGRIFARMTEEAAAARAETQVKKKPKGGQT